MSRPPSLCRKSQSSKTRGAVSFAGAKVGWPVLLSSQKVARDHQRQKELYSTHQGQPKTFRISARSQGKFKWKVNTNTLRPKHLPSFSSWKTRTRSILQPSKLLATRSYKKLIPFNPQTMRQYIWSGSGGGLGRVAKRHRFQPVLRVIQVPPPCR